MTKSKSDSATAAGTADSSPFELKGSLFTLTILHLRSTKLAAIDKHLEFKISQAPGFFHNTPVIIDLQALDDETTVDFVGLYDLLRNRGMIPIAVRNGSEALRQQAAVARLPGLPDRAPIATQPLNTGSDATAASESSVPPASKVALQPGEGTAAKVAPTTEASESAAAGTQPVYRIHKQPVRSGQQVYAAGGDLILLGQVSAGAEVIADGNIHVYASLRGRALAGAKGDTSARIFCRSLEAELVAIAGNYRVIEEQDSDIWGQNVQMYLAEDERLIIERLAR